MAITLGATYRVDNPLGYRQEELWVHYYFTHLRVMCELCRFFKSFNCNKIIHFDVELSSVLNLRLKNRVLRLTN